MWATLIKSKVFTNIQRKGREKLQKKYPNINFTTSGRTATKPKFPNVYVQKMQGKAIGKTLEDAKVNGVISSFQIDVTTNTNQNDADNVADVIADIMIDMGYDMIGDPFPDDSEDVYRNTSRWQMTIGYNDKLNF